MTNRELVSQYAGISERDLQSVRNRPDDFFFWTDQSGWEVYITWLGETFVRTVF